MSHRPGCRRPAARRVLQLTLILLGVLLVGAGPSSALSSIPGIPDCKDAPAPQRPGDGLPGFLDPTPDKPAPAADPFVPNATTSIYDQYGYAGLTWHTYDLGCGGDIRDPGAMSDTLIGNLSLSAATWGIALANGVHNRVSHPQTYMAPLDSVVATVSDRVKQAVWGPWGGVALLGVVALLLWYSSSGRLSTVTRAAAWALLVLAVLSGVTQYPTRVAGFFDDAVTSSIGQVNAGTAGLSNLPSTTDPAHAQGSLLVDRILYEAWLRGELGSSTSPAAQKWGPTLFKASAFSYDETRQAQDPQRAQQLTDQKAQTFKDTADQIQRQDPTAYLALQGKSNSRGGVGFMTLFAMLFTTLFRLVADIFMFAGLVMLRFLVMFFPAVAVLGIMSPMSAIVRRVANMAGASVVNVVSFAAGSAVHTTVISALLSKSDSAGMGLLALVLCLVTTVVAFILLFPLLSLTNIVGLSSGQRGMHSLRNAGRMASRYAVTRRAVGDGEDDAKSDKGNAPTSESDVPGVTEPGPRRDPVTHRAAEVFGRPAPVAIAPAAISGSGSPRPGSDEPPANERPDGVRGPTYVSSRSATAVAERPVATTLRESRPSQRPDSARPSSPDVLEGVIIEGRILDSDVDVPSPTPSVHDSHTQIRSDGIGPRFYDPATKRDVRVDETGSVIHEGDDA